MTQLAFPGALGYGKYAIGGRGGRVIYVDSLADSLADGTFRYAVSVATGPRVVVFRVGGDIVLLDDLGIFDPYITIAGHTAPGDGVCVRNGSLSIRSHDVIIRHMRFRPGDAAYPSVTASDPADRDGVKIQGGYNIMIDRCSLTWGVDENLSTWVQGGVYPHTITVQNCIIGECLYNSIHPSGNHSRGMLIGDGTDNMSVIHNLFISNNRRNPHIKGGATNIEILNNIVYNWGADLNSPGGTGIHFSDPEGSGPTVTTVANNIFNDGPNAGTNPMTFAADVDAGSSIVLNGNTGDTDDAAYIASKAYITAGNIVSDPALNWNQADILANVGARVPTLDAVDTRLIGEVTTTDGALIDSPSDVGGYPTLSSGTPYFDTGEAGIDDTWDSTPTTGNGYTDLENFLSELAGDGIIYNADFSSSFTVEGSNNLSSVRLVYGTFTSAKGDNTATINTAVHGLSTVIMYHVTLDSGGVSVSSPKVVQTGSSLVVTWEDTLLSSGKWAVIGKSA